MIYDMISVYNERLILLKQNPCSSTRDIMWYESMIAEMEAEIAVAELMYEILPPKVISFTTDCWPVVDEICKEQQVICIKIKWSWKHFKFIWYIEYTKLSRKCYS